MKMVALQESEFDDFRKLSIHNYATGIATNTGLGIDTVIASAAKQFDEAFTEKLNSPNNAVFKLIDDSGRQCGYLWFGIRGPDYLRRVFILDIFVEEFARGKGYGKFMLQWLDQKTKELGYHEIALHAFAYNTPAITLYEKMGYKLTNVHMAKKI